MYKDKYKIVVYNTVVGKEWDIEREVLTAGGHDDFHLVRIEGSSDRAFFQEARDAEAVCAWVHIDEKGFQELPRCQILVSPGVGVERFDLNAATEAGICIANIPDYCTYEVAVHTVSLFLDCSRKLTFLDRSIRSGDWRVLSRGKMYRMKGRTYGLISFGRIPRKVSQLLKPFGVNVMAYDPYVPDHLFEEYDVERAETMEYLFASSDYISVHTPHNEATHHLIGREQFELMRNGTILIVTGRGGVVDEAALKDALISGKIACAGIDVIEDDINNTSILTGLENVIMTPRSAYYTEDSVRDLRRKAMEQIVETVREGVPPRSLINKEVLDHARFLKK